MSRRGGEENERRIRMGEEGREERERKGRGTYM